MNRAEMKVVRFNNEDVIATSGGVKWSPYSYIAEGSYTVVDKNENPAYTNCEGISGVIPGTDVFNYLNGVGNNDSNGDILTDGLYYHYDLNSHVGDGNSATYYNWKECDNLLHRAQ